MHRRVVIVMVALLLAVSACSSGIETPAETLQRGDDPASPFGYVIDDVPPGYELCAVSTPSALSLRAEAAATLHVYADGSAADPYAGPLYGVARFAAGPIEELELGDGTEVEVDGSVGWLGTLDGLQVADLPPSGGRVLTYPVDDEQIVQLVVRGEPTADLVALAAHVVITDDSAIIDPGGLPPTFVDLGDLYQVEGQAKFRFAVDHQLRRPDGELEDQLTLLGAAGDQASMEAFRFRAATSAPITVAGRPGVAADIGPDGTGPYVVSWMGEDELILRVFSFTLEPDELRGIAESARRVEGVEWDELRSAFDPATCQ